MFLDFAYILHYAFANFEDASIQQEKEEKVDKKNVRTILIRITFSSFICI